MSHETAQFINRLQIGFLTAEQMPDLIALDPALPCLVRHGRGRLLCASRNVAQRVHQLEAEGDYLRDVSIPATECETARSLKHS